MANWGYLRYTKSSPNTRKVFKRIRRIRGKNLCIHGEDAKRLLVCSPKNTNLKFFWILSIYTVWDGLSQKTISRYCPFKDESVSCTNFYVKFSRQKVLVSGSGSTAQSRKRFSDPTKVRNFFMVMFASCNALSY